MADLFSDLRKQYKNEANGEALFFSAKYKALRLEVPEIGKEFSDCCYIGKGNVLGINCVYVG
jgi:hypothetical protein